MKKIAMYDLEGYLLEVFEVETYVELERQLKLPQASIYSCVNNRQHQVKNRQFKEIKGERVALQKIGDVSMLVNGSTEYKTILKLYKERVICAYESLQEASFKNKISDTSIKICLNGKTSNAGGFEWKYADSLNDN
jgi:hypothetical protein